MNLCLCLSAAMEKPPPPALEDYLVLWQIWIKTVEAKAWLLVLVACLGLMVALGWSTLQIFAISLSIFGLMLLGQAVQNLAQISHRLLLLGKQLGQLQQEAETSQMILTDQLDLMSS